MIVVDLGCAFYPAHPSDESVDRLIERFRPERLIGVDPALPAEGKQMGIHRGTPVTWLRKAAWTYDGVLGFVQPPDVLNGLRSFTTEDLDGRDHVECFDLAPYLFVAAKHDQIVLKMDVEGAEYELLPYLQARGIDQLLERILVEWHGDPLELDLACPVELW